MASRRAAASGLSPSSTIPATGSTRFPTARGVERGRAEQLHDQRGAAQRVVGQDRGGVAVVLDLAPDHMAIVQPDFGAQEAGPAVVLHLGLQDGGHGSFLGRAQAHYGHVNAPVPARGLQRTSPTPEAVRAAVETRARALGFEALGVADAARPWAAGERLRRFVADGRHATMAWMEETLERRAHPQALWPEARSAVVLGLNYGPDTDPRALQAQRGRGAISAYAQGDDYHQLIKGRLKTLAGWMKARLGGEVKVFVDTAALMEKPLAQAAGLGWQGKHTNLVSREFGSWLFLGVILTTLELPPDAPEGGREACGSCRACLDACPTAAFPAPFQLDARRCISYLTIEHEDPIPLEFREALGNRIYGCDDCLAACPWNKFAQSAREMRLNAREELRAPGLAELAALDEAAFRGLFRKSSVERIGRDRLVRNVMYAIGNSGEPALAEAARARLGDASDPVRDAAAWAVERLSPVCLTPERSRPG